MVMKYLEKNLDTDLYNLYILFWLGIGLTSYASALTVPVLFITLDRCFTIKFPLQYNSRESNWLFRSSLLIIFLVYLAGFSFTLMELPLDLSAVRLCGHVSCLLNKYKGEYHWQLKTSISVLNLVCTCYFFSLLWKSSYLML
uniref:Uncharacterized protein n=1 Tax=Ditylenchus dipsaci TaxID=166011 RepID=A0A915DUB3_9BILA